MLISEKEFTIFSEIQKINPNLKIFQEWTGENLDKFYSVRFSKRTASALYAEQDSALVASWVNSLFKSKWDSMYEYCKSSFKVLEGAGSKVTETVTTQDDTTNTTTVSNDVTAFDDDQYSPNTKDTTSSVNGGTMVKKTDRLNQSLTNINYTRYAEYLMNNYLYDTVFADVNSVCTYNIFNCDVEL